MGKLNSDDHCGQESLGRNGVALIVNKSLKCSTWVQSQKQQNDLGLFPRQNFQVIVIRVYAPTTDAKEVEDDQFCEGLQHFLELTPGKKKCPFHHTRLESKSRKSRDTWNNRQVWPWNTNTGQRLTEFCEENILVIANTLFQEHRRWLYTWISPDGQYQSQVTMLFAA